jgi:hypothetical protein
MRKILIVLLTAVLLLALAGCSKGQASGPALAVQVYLEALVAQDFDRITTLSCADWEEQAQLEVDSFAAVTARLEGVSCQEQSTEGDSATVACTGKIITTYDEEDQEIGLEGRTYWVVQQNGEWRMCGYK